MITHIADELQTLVDEASERLKKIDGKAASKKPSPGKWSKKEIIGHLIDSAANNHQRFIRAQEVEQLVFPKYEQDSWVEKQRYNSMEWQELIDFWRLYNRHLSRIIRNISPDVLLNECTITPFEPVTLDYLIKDYLEHLKHHLKQVEEKK